MEVHKLNSNWGEPAGVGVENLWIAVWGLGMLKGIITMIFKFPYPENNLWLRRISRKNKYQLPWQHRQKSPINWLKETHSTSGSYTFIPLALFLAVWMYRGQATLCPSGYLDDGTPTMCSTTKNGEGEQRRYSECTSDGVCDCEGVYSRPEGSAIEGMMMILIYVQGNYLLTAINTLLE